MLYEVITLIHDDRYFTLLFPMVPERSERRLHNRRKQFVELYFHRLNNYRYMDFLATGD